jgi:hypothetical protein
MAHFSFQEVKPDVYCNNEAPNLIFSFFFADITINELATYTAASATRPTLTT